MIIAIVIIGLLAYWTAFATWQNTKSINKILKMINLLNEQKDENTKDDPS